MRKIVTENLVYEILSAVEEIPEGNYPCHRVVNHSGRIAPNFPEQKNRLLAEGVAFKNDVCVDLQKHRWEI